MHFLFNQLTKYMETTNNIDMMVPPQQKSSIANHFVQAIKTDDWPLLQSLMDDGVIWTLPGTSLLSGPAHGVDAVINRAQSLKKFGVKFELIYTLYGWRSVTLLLH